MRVTFCGPNLSRKGEEKGTFHIHVEGCSDIARDPKGYGYRNAEPHFSADVKSVQDALEFLYSDFLAEDPEATWEDFRSDAHFAPCVGLPLKTEEG